LNHGKEKEHNNPKRLLCSNLVGYNFFTTKKHPQNLRK